MAYMPLSIMFFQGFHLLLRGGPVIWPLFFCAVLLVAVMIERLAYLGSVQSRPQLPRVAVELRHGLPILDTIITIAPLLELLGTVTGMILAAMFAGQSGGIQRNGGSLTGAFVGKGENNCGLLFRRLPSEPAAQRLPLSESG